MKDILIIKFIEYLRENNPDVYSSLNKDGSLVEYANEKLLSIETLLLKLQEEKRPSYIIEELCMSALTGDLRPSRYSYIKELIEEEFLIEYHQLLGLGILRYEIFNILKVCNPLFEAFGFNEGNEEDKLLRYTITGTVKEYFELSENENRVSWPIMPTINSQIM